MMKDVVKVTEWTKTQLDKLKAQYQHTNYDSVIKLLLLNYVHNMGVGVSEIGIRAYQIMDITADGVEKEWTKKWEKTLTDSINEIIEKEVNK